jgi:small-conductance mechanosensitive channel
VSLNFHEKISADVTIHFVTIILDLKQQNLVNIIILALFALVIFEIISLDYDPPIYASPHSWNDRHASLCLAIG